MKQELLVGCIQKLGNVIQTRYFYVNPNTSEVKDVTLSLYTAIEAFNRKAHEVRSKGGYAMIIPYEYKNGLVEYSFGCGLSHYLQANVFEELVISVNGDICFPLTKCVLSMYTPSDVKDILGVSSVFSEVMGEALLKRFAS